MRTLGILGGMGWPSTAEAYRAINTEVGRRLGGTHSAPLVIWSFDFAEVHRLQSEGDWPQAGQLLADAAARLETAGAEALMLCTNTMHRVAPAIEAATTVPLLHIADPTAEAVRRDAIERVALLGTRFTMEGDFYRGRLERHGLDVIVPEADQRQRVHDIIYDELVHDVIRAESRDAYLEIIADLRNRGADGVIAGCTEIELLLRADDVDLPYYPTTQLHTLAAVDWILGDRSD